MIPSGEKIALVATAGLAMSLTPGPSMLFMLSRSLQGGVPAGLYSSVGLALGGLVHVALVTFGLASFFKAFPSAVGIMETLGALYLIYLGMKELRSQLPEATNEEAETQIDRRKYLLQGVWVEICNPKTALFFLAFLPQFIDYEKGSLPTQFLVLGALIPLTAVPSDLAVCLFASQLRRQVDRKSTSFRVLRYLAGCILLFLGALVLWRKIA